MNLDNQSRLSGMGVSVGQMRKELIKHGIEIDKEIDVAQTYNMLMAEKGLFPNENQQNRFSTPSEQNNKKLEQKTGFFSQKQNMEAQNNELGRQVPNLPQPLENKSRIQTILNAIDQSKEKKNNQNLFVVGEQSNSDLTYGQSSNQEQPRNEAQNNQSEQIPEQSESNQNSARQSRFQLFNFGQQPQSAKNSLSNNRASSASVGNNRQSGGGILGIGGQNQQIHQNQRVSNEGNNRISQEYQSQSPGNNYNQFLRMNNPNSSPGLNYGNRSQSNSVINQQQGFIPNENSSRRVSNQSQFNMHQQDSFSRRQQQLESPFNHQNQQNTFWKSGGDGKSMYPIQGSTPYRMEGSGVFNRNQYTPNYQNFQRTTSFTESKMNQGLLDTARALSQSQRKQTKQNDSLFNLTQFALFGDKKVQSRRSEKMMSNLEDDSIYYNQNQQQKLNFKNRLKILYSRIETSHVVMVLMIGLFAIFFLQSIYQYLTHKPELQFCDSTLRQEQIDSTQCIPCPQNAICLNNNVKCKQSFVLVDKKCIPNPMIEPNAIKYITTVVQNLQFIQAQYYCYDPNSSGYGNNISRPYKEHKWDSIVNILSLHHSKDLLFFDTLTKVQDYLKSKSIREQFDISYDSSRETYYVTTFEPSLYCRARLYIKQNIMFIIAAAALFFIMFLLYQVTSVRRFIYFFKLYNTQQKLSQPNQAPQNQQQNTQMGQPNQISYQNNPNQSINSNIKESQQNFHGGQLNQRYLTPQQQYEQNVYYSQQQQNLQQHQQVPQQQYLQVPQQYLQVPHLQPQYLQVPQYFSNQSQRRNRQS